MDYDIESILTTTYKIEMKMKSYMTLVIGYTWYVFKSRLFIQAQNLSISQLNLYIFLETYCWSAYTDIFVGLRYYSMGDPIC